MTKNKYFLNRGHWSKAIFTPVFVVVLIFAGTFACPSLCASPRASNRSSYSAFLDKLIGGLNPISIDSSSLGLNDFHVQAGDSNFFMSGDFDPTFNTGTSTDGAIWNLAVQSDGKILISGSFPSFNGVVNNNIARLNADGSVDLSFVSGSPWIPTSGVRSMAIQPNGKIVIAHDLSTYGGVSRNGIARINADGSLDSTFDPGTGTYSIGSVSILTDGKVIICGGFSIYNDTNRNLIARLNSDGSLDTAFNPGSGFSDGYIKTCTIQTDNKILVAGTFTNFSGIIRNGLLRLNSNGSLDLTFDPGSGIDVSSGVRIEALAVQSDGKIVIGGFFTTYNGMSRNRIARLNDNGSLDSSFDPGDGFDNDVSALWIQPNGKVLAGGYFTSYRGVLRNGLARINLDGGLDELFNSSLLGGIYAVSMQPDGKILVGGSWLLHAGAIARLLNDCCQIPTISSISPPTPVLTEVDQIVTVGGIDFQQGLTAIVTFPNGQSATLSGTQIQEVTNTSFKMRITLGSPGNWSLQVKNPDGGLSSTFPFIVQPNLQAPTVFSIDPVAPAPSQSDQDIFVSGVNFARGLRVDISFPDGGGTTLIGAQIQNVTGTSFIMRATLNAPGAWSIKIKNPNNQESTPFPFIVSSGGSNPFISSITPSSPITGGADQNVTVVGGNFQNGLRVNVTFPNGGIAILQGTGQIQNVLGNSFLMRITLNAPGTWTIRVVNPDNTQSQQLMFSVQPAGPPPSGLPTSVLSPVIGPLKVTSTNEHINDGLWEFDQYRTGNHTPNGGISYSNDTFAWDVNLYEPTNGNADAGNPVFAVEAGEIVKYVGNPVGGNYGAVLVAHPTTANPIWFSGYEHMTDIRVAVGQIVNSTTMLGNIGRIGAENDHLHFVVYSGSNTRGNLISFNPSITERTISPLNSPSIINIDPPSVTQSLARQLIRISGANFSADSIILVRDRNGHAIEITPEPVTTTEAARITSISASLITARVPFTLDGKYTLSVLNPSSGANGNLSAALGVGVSNNYEMIAAPGFLHQTPVIFIPGTMGSQLGIRNSGPLEGFAPLFPGIPFVGKSELKNGTLDTTPIRQRSIVATGLLTTYLGDSIPLLDLDFYGTTLSTLFNYGGYKLYNENHDPNLRTWAGCDTSQTEANFFIFPYDWRRSNDLSARELKDFVDCVRKIRDPNNADPNFKVDIVAHSQGGLVARRYILEGLYGQVQNYDPRVKTLITLGTPWVGAPKFISVIMTGEHESLNKLMFKSTLRDVARYMPGAHELIPSPVYADELKDSGPGDYPFGETYNYDFWNMTNNNAVEQSYNSTSLVMLMNRYTAENSSIRPGDVTKDFHDTRYQGNRLMDDWRNDHSPITYYNFVGRCTRANSSEYNTIGSLVATTETVFTGGHYVTRPKIQTLMTRGDCTVPEISSTRQRNNLNYRGPAIQKIFENVDHGGLVKSSRVLDCVTRMLNGENISSCSQATSDVLQSPKKGDTVDAGAYYLQMLGPSIVRISDGFGNTSEPLSSINAETVPTIETSVTGDSQLFSVIPLDQIYKVVFRTSDEPLMLAITKSAGQLANLAIRYTDAAVPPNVLCKFELSSQVVTPLACDSDGDGTFDTPVNPTIVVMGTQAEDIDPPNVTVNETVQNGSSRIVLEATDIGTGVGRIMYSLDGKAFQPYSTPLTLNPSQTPTIYVFADDQVLNRSGLVTHNLTASNAGFMITGPNVASAGSEITASWIAPPGRPADDWIGLFNVGGLNSTFISRQYTGGSTSGALGFILPNQTGIYEFRYLTNDGFTSVAATGPITVTNKVRLRRRADFDGDGKTDLSVYRPSDENWYAFKSGGGGALVRNWGIAGDVPTPGDFDGDGKTDAAAFRPSSGQWFILRSSDLTVDILSFGIDGDRPVPGDYDGDGKTDVAQFRPSEGTWYVFRSSDNGVSITNWGEATDVVVQADYDGDGKTDVAVFRPSTGVWYAFRSTAEVMVVGWGVAGDKPVEADYDGDGKDDVAVYRPSEGNWYVFRSSDNSVQIVNWGNATDVPSPGDYDGDGKDDFAVFRDGTWFAYESTGGPVVSNWGVAGDAPIPAKYIPEL